MWPDRASDPGPLTYESGALSIALRGPAGTMKMAELHPWKVIPFAVRRITIILGQIFRALDEREYLM